MSDAAANNLTEEKVQQLLAAVGSRPAEDTEKTEAIAYDWTLPHHFSNDQFNELKNYRQKLAAAIAKKFTRLYHSDFNVTVDSSSQHFADDFLNSDDEQSHYRIAFGADRNQLFGFISMSGRTASIWTTQLLGDLEPKEEDSDRDLSPLEESLLLDVASVLLEALSSTYDNYEFCLAKDVVRGQLPIELQGTEELCKIIFNAGKADSEDSSQAYFLMPCDKLEPVLGESTQADKKFSAKDTSKALIGHMQRVLVCVTAQLASGSFTFEQIMSLGVDDILLLNKKVDEPMELIVEGRPVFRGRPAKSAGKFAVVITELCDTK